MIEGGEDAGPVGGSVTSARPEEPRNYSGRVALIELAPRERPTHTERERERERDTHINIHQGSGVADEGQRGGSPLEVERPKRFSSFCPICRSLRGLRGAGGVATGVKEAGEGGKKAHAGRGSGATAYEDLEALLEGHGRRGEKRGDERLPARRATYRRI
jgi:hypothetical protein